MGKLQNIIKIVFFGTSAFAVPILKKLHDGGFDIVAVVTQPDKPAGRKQQPLPSPVKRAALELGLKIFQPTSPLPPPQAWGGIEGGVELQNIDIAVVASYGRIIPKVVFDAPKHGALNVHPSLLPKYRGPSPIQSAILNGNEETGVTIMKMDEEMDHGSIVANSKFKIQNSKVAFKELHDELAELGANLLVEILPEYLKGETKPVHQDHSKATYTKLVTKEDGRINWQKPADEIERQIRAYSEWPVAWTTLGGKRLKIYDAQPISPLPHPPPQGEGNKQENFSPLEGEEREGVIGSVKDSKILVNTGSGQLEILELQLEGGKRMAVKDFVNGYPGLKGKILV